MLSTPPIVTVNRWLYHGSSPDMIEHIRNGGRLEIVDDYHSDPGDMGQAVYLTDMLHEARMYGPDVIRAHVVMNRALFLDFRADKAAARAWYNEHEMLWGSPIHGNYRRLVELSRNDLTPEEEREARDLRRNKSRDRIDASRRWREEMLADGYDGIVTRGWDFGEVAAVYEPETAIVAYQVWPGGNRPRRAHGE